MVALIDARIAADRRAWVRSGDLLNGEIYRSEWFATEALTRADLAMHQDALTAAGWTPVPFQPRPLISSYERSRRAIQLWRPQRELDACGPSNGRV